MSEWSMYTTVKTADLVAPAEVVMLHVSRNAAVSHIEIYTAKGDDAAQIEATVEADDWTDFLEVLGGLMALIAKPGTRITNVQANELPPR